MLLGMRIAMLRIRAGMSQSALAERLHVSPSTVGSYEQGRREPSCAMLVALSDALGVTTDYLLTGHLDNRNENVSKCDLLNHMLIKVNKQSIEISFSEDIEIPLVEFLPE